MSFDSTVHAKAVEIAKLNYEITAAAGSGHPTSGASLAHLTTILMYSHMRHEPANPAHPSADRLVLSEGHACPIIYAAAADMGIAVERDGELGPMTRDEAMTLRDIHSPIEGHPNPAEGFPFFDTATGSLGQGLSQAAGLAAAAKQDGLDKRIFCIVGDGESRKGQIWEALDFIKDYDLTAVCPIFNCNAYGQSDAVSPQQTPEMLAQKLEAFGFSTRVIDGHQPSEIQQALSDHAQLMNDPAANPVAIVARTVKGWGAPATQGHGQHGKPASDEALQTALQELEETAKQIGAAADMALKPGLLSQKKPEAPTINPAPGFHEALEQRGMSDVLEKGKLATRKAYGVALTALGHSRSDVVALDGDVKNSTYSQQFYKDGSLQSRFYESRIAEQNMFSAAAGLSAGGKLPFCSTFAKFVARGYDQIEMALNSRANFKIVGSHIGANIGPDGPSQMGLTDVAWFRSFTTMRRQDGNPGFYLLQPSDAYQAYALTLKMAEYDGPCYMRTLRPDTEFLYGENDNFELGGHEVLSEGRDLLIVAAGYMVHEANKALDKLDAQGIDATLVDLYSMPFDGEALLDLANENNGNVLTLEDNYGAALGSAVADVAAEDGGGFTVQQMHVRRLPKSGRSPEEVLAFCGLSDDDIVKQAMQMLELSAT
jgi:transketolase